MAHKKRGLQSFSPLSFSAFCVSQILIFELKIQVCSISLGSARLCVHLHVYTVCRRAYFLSFGANLITSNQCRGGVFFYALSPACRSEKCRPKQRPSHDVSCASDMYVKLKQNSTKRGLEKKQSLLNHTDSQEGVFTCVQSGMTADNTKATRRRSCVLGWYVSIHPR